MTDFQSRVQHELHPNGVKHPNQAEPDALINEIRTIMRERDEYRTKYFHKICEPVKGKE